MKPHYRGTNRMEMERVGKALPKKVYQCGLCSAPLSHDECYKHQLYDCHFRPGSTVKPAASPQ